jgi:5-methylcytosine-specific restriction endonuclease McrA
MLRRRKPMKPSRGTQIPPAIRLTVHLRDNGCVGQRLGWPGPHSSALELDHVRASGGISMKSPTTADNLVALCYECHRAKTLNGRALRPELVAYLEAMA